MLKEPVLFAMLMAGGSAFIGSAYGAFAPDSRVHASLLQSEAPPPRFPAPPVSIESDSELGPPTLVAQATIAPLGAAQPKRVHWPALRVCGEWSEVGAIYQSRTGASGVHHVRGLCY